MTQNRPENSPESTDPRLLLPEWLRDPESTSVNTEPEQDPFPVVETRAPNASAWPSEASRAPWPEPPPRRSTKLDPAAMIRADQLPLWIRQLGQATEAAPPASPGEGLALTQAAQVASEPTTASRLAESAELSEVQPGDNRIPIGKSDLTPLRFALIAGATFVLLLAALALAFA